MTSRRQTELSSQLQETPTLLRPSITSQSNTQPRRPTPPTPSRASADETGSRPHQTNSRPRVLNQPPNPQATDKANQRTTDPPAVIMEAYVHGVSTRSVDDLVKALGADTGISKSEVSRICQDLDGQLTAFRGRPLDHVRFPYVYLDATYCKARVEHQIVSRAVVVATGITKDGGREVLGVMVGDSETELFWTEFLRSLRERGLAGVRLVIGDHHLGLVKAIRKVMLGSAYQRCRVHFLRNVFSVINKEAGGMVAATIRTIFAQPTADAVRTQLDTVADMLGTQFPKVKAMLLEAKGDLTAFAAFPERHWKKIQSTNPLERINREIKRRTDVVQVFPNDDALLRLVTAVLFELHDEWIAFPRRYLPEGSMDQLYPAKLPQRAPALPKTPTD
ncbi:IS256 family transposase [Kitasatospora sp. NPDC101176]|uniref:IS256 family transposase n=1 Tax=Kitasatospora sp. NPDC101176 TaxID=3364099 RepID=UPI00380BDD80